MSLKRILRNMQLRNLGVIRRSLILAAGLLMAQLSFIAPLAHAAADTCTWTGAIDTIVTNSANWTGCDNGNTPETGDNLVFPATGVTNFSVDFVDLTVFHDITVSSSSYAIAGSMYLSGTLNAFSSASYAGLITFQASSGTTGLNVQLGTPTFGSGIQLDVSGTATSRIFTTNSSLTLPTISGSTTTLNFWGNPTAPMENFISSTSPSDFTASNGVQILQSNFTCRSDNCLGADSNEVTVDYGDGTGSVLELDAADLVLDNDINFDVSSSGDGPPSLQVTQSATTTGTMTAVADGLISIAADQFLLLNGPVHLGNNNMTYTGASGSQIVHNGVISGNGNVIINGYVQMINNNSYAGETIVHSGAVLVASAANAMGTTAGDTTIEDGGTLLFELSGNTTIPENITVSGAGYYDGAIEIFDDTDTATLSGIITLDGDTTVANSLAGSASINFSGSITGSGNLTFVGDSGITGTGFRFSGSSANDYAGTTYLDAANLHLSKDADVQAIPGDVVATAVPAHTAYLTVESNEQIADDVTITIDSDASVGGLVLTGHSIETVGTIEGDGLIDIGSAIDFLQVGGGDVSGTFNGQVLGPDDGVIFKVGSGTWDFQGSNDTDFSTAVAYQVNDGTLLANANDTSLSVSGFWVAGDNAVLGGNGEIGPLTVTTGTVAPGNSPGCLYPAGDVSFASGTHFAVQLNDSVACTGFDRLSASGAVTLNSPSLDISLGYVPAVGTTFDIVTGSSVTGYFAGLADNATFVVGGNTLRINYTSTGVKLTVVSAVTSGSLGVTGTNMLVGLPVAMLLIAAAGIAIVRRRKLTHYRTI